jgi:hypothetical protein
MTDREKAAFIHGFMWSRKLALPESEVCDHRMLDFLSKALSCPFDSAFEHNSEFGKVVLELDHLLDAFLGDLGEPN